MDRRATGAPRRRGRAPHPHRRVRGRWIGAPPARRDGGGARPRPRRRQPLFSTTETPLVTCRADDGEVSRRARRRGPTPPQTAPQTTRKQRRPHAAARSPQQHSFNVKYVPAAPCRPTHAAPANTHPTTNHHNQRPPSCCAAEGAALLADPQCQRPCRHFRCRTRQRTTRVSRGQVLSCFTHAGRRCELDADLSGRGPVPQPGGVSAGIAI